MATRFRRRIFPSSSAGRKTVGVSSPWQTCTRATQKQARATSAFTECKFMTGARPECIGSFTRSARATASAITSAVNACQSQSPLVVIPFTHSRQLRRCRMVWMNCFLPVFCEKNQLSLFAAKRSISMCPRTLILFSRVMCSPVKCIRKDHSAITPAFIPRSRTIRCSI